MAAVVAGHQPIDDPDGATSEKVGWHEFNIVEWLRQSAADGDLTPAPERPNLTITTYATVRRLVIEHGSCRGVECGTREGGARAFADSEVIPAAQGDRHPTAADAFWDGPRATLNHEQDIRVAGVSTPSRREPWGDRFHRPTAWCRTIALAPRDRPEWPLDAAADDWIRCTQECCIHEAPALSPTRIRRRDAYAGCEPGPAGLVSAIA